MGICSPPEVFHKTVYQCLENLDGVPRDLYMDDIIVWGSTIEQHDERLEEAVKKLEHIFVEIDVPFSVDNGENCADEQISAQIEVPYSGHNGENCADEQISAEIEFPTQGTTG